MGRPEGIEQFGHKVTHLYKMSGLSVNEFIDELIKNNTNDRTVFDVEYFHHCEILGYGYATFHAATRKSQCVLSFAYHGIDDSWCCKL